MTYVSYNVRGISYGMQDIHQIVEFKPPTCSLANKTPCRIGRRGYEERIRCYDILFPFLLRVPNFFCTAHAVEEFSGLNYIENSVASTSISKIISMISGKPRSLVIFKRTIITRELFDYIILMYKNTYNYQAISNHLKDIWLNHFKTYVVMNNIVGSNYQLNPQEMKSIEGLFTFSNKFISVIVDNWWQKEGNNYEVIKSHSTVGEPNLLSQIDLLRRTTGTVIRMDHTYKAVSSIGVTKDGVWVQYLLHYFLFL